MKRIHCIATIAGAAILLSAPAFAETTLAGGKNGKEAQKESTMKSGGMKSGGMMKSDGMKAGGAPSVSGASPSSSGAATTK